MPRTYKITETCSRCPRVLEEREASLEEILDTAEETSSSTYPAVSAYGQDGSKLHAFDVLCSTCDEYVRNAVKELFTPIDSPSVKRKKRSSKTNGASQDVDIEFTVE